MCVCVGNLTSLRRRVLKLETHLLGMDLREGGRGERGRDSAVWARGRRIKAAGKLVEGEGKAAAVDGRKRDGKAKG